MAPIEWKDSFSTGVPAVDHEHRELIDLVNRVDDVLTAQSDADETNAALGDLFLAVSSHFALEERFMREHAYDQATEHKRDHERLLDDFRDIMDEFEATGRLEDEAVIQAFTARVEAWFVNHFRRHDARLHNQLGTHPH